MRFDVPAGDVDDAWVEALKDAFHRAHEAEYGHRFDAEIEIINIRAVGIGRVEDLQPAELEQGDGDPSAREDDRARGRLRRRAASRRRCVAPFYERERLRAGDRIEGPAVIEQYDSTTVVPPGLVAEIDRFGNIVVDCSAAVRTEAERAAGLATPILMRVIGGAFAAIAKEMAGVLYRMSYSSIIRESEDLGAGIFDAEGNELAESDSTPMFMGAMPKIVKNVIEILGDDIHEGDVILHNDPYGGATHSPDVAIVIPIFHDGRARRLLRRVGARARHRRRLSPASPSTSSTTGRRGTSTARSRCRSRASGRPASGSTSWTTSARRRSTTATSAR